MYMLNFDLPNISGLIGVAIILVSYYLLQTAKLSPRDVSYSLANLIGSILILWSLYYDWNLPSVIIECAWIMISLIGLRKALRHKTIASNL